MLHWSYEGKMGVRHERRRSRLLNFERWPIWWAMGLPLTAAVFVGGLQFYDFIEETAQAPSASVAAEPAHFPQSTDLVVESQSSASEIQLITPEKKSEIEKLFSKVAQEKDEKILRDLKRMLLETFAGQEDCWSCEGAAYFDRFDQIAGKGEARKPLGLFEWIEAGDEAFLAQRLDLARKYYSAAQQMMDERVFQDDEKVDESALGRVRDRCVQLGCR